MCILRESSVNASSSVWSHDLTWSYSGAGFSLWKSCQRISRKKEKKQSLCIIDGADMANLCRQTNNWLYSLCNYVHVIRILEFLFFPPGLNNQYPMDSDCFLFFPEPNCLSWPFCCIAIKLLLLEVKYINSQQLCTYPNLHFRRQKPPFTHQKLTNHVQCFINDHFTCFDQWFNILPYN